MPQAVYDEHAGTYDDKHQEAVSASGFDVSHFYEYKVAEIARILAGRGDGVCAPISILDFGCGVGNVDPYIRKYFPGARIFGIDISGESVKLAREKNKAFDITYDALTVAEGTESPFDVKFDLIFVSCVFQHAPKAVHLHLMSFLERNMNPGAYLFIFEHNPFNPVTRSVFSSWDRKIDENADLYTPSYFVKLASDSGLKVTARRFTVFFPGFLSFLLPLEKYMWRIPFGGQYYVMARKG